MILSLSNTSILVILKTLFEFTFNKNIVFPDINNKEDLARTNEYIL